jgi:hypothetical protein
MTIDQHAPAFTAQMVSTHAHDLRNQIATLRSIHQLLDDPEIAEALADAVTTLQVTLERTIAAARIELGTHGDAAPHDLSMLLEMATRRARREGCTTLAAEHRAIDSVDVLVPGPLFERLLTDLLWSAQGRPAHVSIAESVATVSCATTDAAVDRAHLERLAIACGCTLQFQDASATVSVPLAPPLT